MQLTPEAFAIIIQARLGSSRLPDKVIKKIGNLSVIEVLVQRLLTIFPGKMILFAIPETAQNDKLYEAISKMGLKVIRGSEQNVYQRFSQALNEHPCNAFVRITADCPLLSAEFLREGMKIFSEGAYHVVHSGPKMAEGLDFEIIDTNKFLELSKKGLTDLQKEHPTLFFYENKNTYRIFEFEPDNRDDSGFRITLDEERDLLVLESIAEHLKDRLTVATWEEIRAFLVENESVIKLNSDIERNEGLKLDREKRDKV